MGGEFGIGQSVSRFEYPRLLRGAGRFVNDISLPRSSLRSPHAARANWAGHGVAGATPCLAEEP